MGKIFLLLMAICLTTSIYAASQNKELEKYTTAAKQVVKDYNAGNYVDIWKRCSKKIQEQVKCEDLVNSFKNIKSTYSEITKIDKTPEITPDCYVFKIHFGKNNLFMFLSLSNEGKYTELYFLNQIPIRYPKVTNKTTIDELAKTYISQKVNAGLAIGIVNKGKESTHFYGVIKKGTDIKPNNNSEFEIGSITKTFTAIALL